MNVRIIDENIALVPYYPNEAVALAWYQDKEVCRQVDNIDHVYSLDRLRAMYDFLSAHGECFYIRYKGKLIGDISLRDDSEIAIVICREYQNRHIGRKCVQDLLDLAKEKGMSEVRANIYAFNEQSRKMFQAIGFQPSGDEWYTYSFQDS
ncbi:MAG: GNAT family N-acetyltransferase [Eubacterium sp.]|nr:GNAT family N-acetyltransferase [Eubacterium sp.]